MKYTTYPCLGNRKLAEALVARAEELGLKPSGTHLNDITRGGMTVENNEYHFDDEETCRECLENGQSEYGKLGDILEFLFGPKPQEVVLNEEYTAMVTPTEITVGCQTFPISKLEEVLRVAKRLKNG
jgi:hypothetical protein